MKRWMLAGVLAVIALGAAPTMTYACCAGQAFELVWPFDGAEDVPLDVAVLLYGTTWGAPLNNWTLELATEAGEAVAFTAAMESAGGDWFLLTAVPDAPLAPDTQYQGTFTLEREDGTGPRGFSFRTGAATAGSDPLPAPGLEYHGVGVVMIGEDGSTCLYSTMEEDGALAVTLTGAALADRLLVVEVRDEAGETIFDALLSGAWMDRQVLLGGESCSERFPVDPCAHYCARAAALDHLGAAGPWTPWACSEAVGWWSCGESGELVLFGDAIPAGMAPRPEVAACMDPGDLPPAPGADASGAGPADGSVDGEDTGSGCAASGSPSQGPWSLFVLIGAVALLSVLRSRRPTVSRVVLLVLLCASFLSAGCGGGSQAPEPIDPASLTPDDIVFAAGRGGGFAMTAGDMFFWSHHPDFTLYVFGDRRLVYLDQTTIPTLGYRVWREGTVPEETFAELLDLAAAVEPDDGGSYERCPAADGGTEVLFVGLPGLTVTASCFTAFGGCPEDDGMEPAYWETPPPDALVDLFEALSPLRKLPGEIVETDRVLLGMQPMDTPYWGCDLSNAVPWPFDELAFPGDLQEGGYGTTPLVPPLAGQVRDFLRDHLEDHGGYFLATCVSRHGEAYLVFYDDMLPDEEGYPF